MKGSMDPILDTTGTNEVKDAMATDFFLGKVESASEVKHQNESFGCCRCSGKSD